MNRCNIRAAVVAAVLAGVSAASAHPLSPALLQLSERAPGVFSVRWKTSALRTPGSDLQPVLPSNCRSVTDVVVEDASDDELLRTWTIDCGGAGIVGLRVGLRGLGPARIDALVRVEMLDGRLIRGVIGATQPTIEIPAEAARAVVVWDYLRLGVEHILSGPDHLLFVFGLLLLVRGVAPLVKTITAFTVGHSVTLTLAALGLVRLPAALMELLIALSVFLLAVELARRDGGESSPMRRRPWAVAGGFGLLHGLGFAGALAEVGLPHNEIPAALFSFNLGIEIGQLTFVVAVYPLRAALRRLPPLPLWIEALPRYAMGSLAALWCFERLANL